MNAQARIAADAASWSERNQRWLAANIARLRARMEAMQTGDAIAMPLDETTGDFVSALDRCGDIFGLSRFERQVLLLCAGVALDTGLARAVSEVGGQADGAPNFSLAMSALEDPHWDALSPQAPLRHWSLLVLEPGYALARAPLRIDERVLHWLTGVAAIDERLEPYVELLPAPAMMDAAVVPPWVADLEAAFAAGDRCIRLEQPGTVLTRDALSPLLAATGRPALWLRDLPDDATSLSLLLRLIDREVAMSAALPVLDLRLRGSGTHDGAILERLHGRLRSPLILLGDDIAAPPDLRIRRIALPAWTPASQSVALLHAARSCGMTLDDLALRHAVAEACEQFSVSDPRVLGEVAESLAAGTDSGDAAQRAWHALRAHSRGGLDTLAERIDATTTPEDLVLPPAQSTILKNIGRQLQHRRRVYRDWGFAARSKRGLGLAALFAGESGTGKTMAAEAIANAAGLDLYRIDLASTVSKYIGETEKNLKRIFDAAEASGAVLLFDEADALFGKRSEVKDSHDRYANIETAYLLQRIEAYRGLAILTTNMKSALDRAFLRRIRFVVQFPFPDETARAELWRRQFPPQAPLADDVRWEALARLHLTGGNIRSVALNAAFMAAHEGTAIAHRQLVDAAHAELAKLERSAGGHRGGVA